MPARVQLARTHAPGATPSHGRYAKRAPTFGNSALVPARKRGQAQPDLTFITLSLCGVPCTLGKDEAARVEVASPPLPETSAVTDAVSCRLTWRLFLPACSDATHTADARTAEQVASRRARGAIPATEHHRPMWQMDASAPHPGHAHLI
ncbi:hypothetical protein GCM10010412_087300 [Nonomuraea recticatena]|uniref:Uncharacterized protein n=1 Tax=Nonomuraea recticatena TaxID=46178 RepID=A0ABN3T6N0_9ACTN